MRPADRALLVSLSGMDNAVASETPGASMLIRAPLAIMTGLAGGGARAYGDLRIENGRIAAIGDLRPMPGEEVVDASGCVVYPGWVNTHHHLFQGVMKAAPAGIGLPLLGWLREVPYRFWKRLDEDAMRTAARIGIAQMLLSGTTTLADHHYLFGAALGYDPTAMLFEEAGRFGMRYVLCRGGATRSRSLDTSEVAVMPTEPIDEFLAAVEATVQRYHDPAPASMRRVAIAPATPFWSCEPGQLEQFAAAARGMGIRLHTHLSETLDYLSFAREVHGCTPVEFMAGHGWLGDDVWFAHLVHVSDAEIGLIARTGTGVAHCPQSNCRLGSGIAPIPALDRAGAVVSIGVDGASNEAADMIMETHACWNIHRAVGGAGAVSAEEVLRWATAGGARALGLPGVGTIEAGQSADLAIYRLEHPRYAGLHDPAVGPIVAGGAADLRRLIVQGRTVVRDGAIPGLDLGELADQARRAVARLTA
jgi:8-oxoguanine deaminase